MVGGAATRLVIVRGNSASGKSTVAQRLRRRLGRGVAWVEQDHPFEETVRRHAARPLAAEVGPDQLRSWYRERDLLGLPGEVLIGPDRDADAIVELIIDQVDFCRPPVLDRVAAGAHVGWGPWS